MGACTSTASEAASKQVFEYILLGTPGRIKERIEASSRKAGETTPEGVPAECIGIKPRLLRRRSILVVRGSLLVVLEDLSLGVCAI